jgi:hypothetical protein
MRKTTSNIRLALKAAVGGNLSQWKDIQAAKDRERLWAEMMASMRKTCFRPDLPQSEVVCFTENFKRFIPDFVAQVNEFHQ